MLLAAFGVVVQLGVVVYSAMITYYPPWASIFTKDGEPVIPVAFPIMAAGTYMVAIGMFLCSAIVETSTTEIKWKADVPEDEVPEADVPNDANVPNGAMHQTA